MPPYRPTPGARNVHAESDNPASPRRPEAVVILGSTGSVGGAALDVIARHADKYRVVGLAARGSVAALRRQCLAFKPHTAVLTQPAAARQLAAELAAAGAKTRVRSGLDAVSELAGGGADIVVCGIVGAVGLRSTLAAVRGGKKTLIANKEPLVMLGATIMREARASGAVIIPLDSEHNAIFQCLPQPLRAGGGSEGAGIRSLVLTASGGPLRRLPLAEFRRVTPRQACAHPTWRMGPKISVDSATMMNKGLELIEAAALFSLPATDIDIVIHPQSIVHSAVEYVDGSVLAQLGCPDMRVPIAHALGWPQRVQSGARRLSLVDCARLDFEAPDQRRFPCLALAREAARLGGAAPTVMNAANEVAVQAFLKHGLRFDKIPQLVERVMQRLGGRPDSGRECDLAAALAADAEARDMCRQML